MNEIKKIVIKSHCKLYDGAKQISKFVLKDNLVSFLDYVDNPGCSMFVADYYEKYVYRVDSEVFKSNFKDICNEIINLFESKYISNDKSVKHTATIYFENKTSKSCVFHNELEEIGLNELSRLIKCTIAPCEFYPDWLGTNELLLDKKTLEYIEKIKNGEI